MGERTLWLSAIQRFAGLGLYILSVGLLLLTLYVLGTFIYNVFFHPLRSYPGPLLWRMTRLPRDWYMYHGVYAHTIAAAHKKYGPIIRTAPNEISYADSQAWTDIYAHHPGRPEWPKDPKQRGAAPNGIPHILNADKDDHARYRRLLAHAFSEKGLREQEGLVMKYIDLMVTRLGEMAAKGESADMVTWFNMSAFDIIGDLSWGEAFNSLQDGKMHDWIPTIIESVTYVFKDVVVENLGLAFLNPVPKHLSESRIKNFRYAGEKVQERIARGGQRGDFWDRILIKSVDDNKTGEGMSQAEMLNNAVILVLGGSETSATLLSGVTYLLLKHPKVMKRLVLEIRTTFESDKDITILSVSHLKYTGAVLDEAMRLYPPVAFPAIRVPPAGGAWACGKHVPEGTAVAINNLAMNRGPNFYRGNDFLPERWLDDAPAEFANDNKAAFQPMSVGTRNCIGRNLAYAEMRLTLAKILWHFDLALDERTKVDWFDQKNFILWLKDPLYVKLAFAKH